MSEVVLALHPGHKKPCRLQALLLLASLCAAAAAAGSSESETQTLIIAYKPGQRAEVRSPDIKLPARWGKRGNHPLEPLLLKA
jgi:hypothetical protein